MHLTAEALASLGPDAPLVARDDDMLSAASTGVDAPLVARDDDLLSAASTGVESRKRKAGFLDVTTRQARDAMRLAGGTKVVPSRWRPRGFAPDAKFSCALDAIVVAANVSHVPLDAATEGRVYQSVMTQISTRGLSAKEMEKCASDIGLCLHFDKAIM
jgi:hypothetical protein